MAKSNSHGFYPYTLLVYFTFSLAMGSLYCLRHTAELNGTLPEQGEITVYNDAADTLLHFSQ